MTAERGSAEGQWLTWLERIAAEGPSPDPEALEIWGYTDRPSYAPGEPVGLHVSTTATTWGFEVWRDGCVFEKVYEQDGLAGARHPVGDDVVASGCGWPQAASFEIPDSWASGGYIVVLKGSRAGQEVTQDAFFVLRPAVPGRHSGLAMVAATYTWQEYNDWAISHGYSVWTVAAGWARYDALTFRWLEANGYEPELLSQWDLDRDPSVLDGYRTVVTTGHDEYWTAGGRRVLDRFITEGGRYARLGGNIVWQVRLEDDMATQVCHKYAAHADPERHSEDIDRRTGAFEAHYIDWPAATTYGANGLRGVYSRMGGLSPRGPGGFIVYRPQHWAFAGADVYYGDVLGADVPLVGYETDGVDYTFRQGLPYPTGADGSPAGLEILALTPVTLEEEDHGQAGNLISIADGDLSFAAEAIHGEDTPENRNKLRYGSAVITAMPKGKGEVFCAGTTEWCFALARGDRQVETITRNVLDRFLRS